MAGEYRHARIRVQGLDAGILSETENGYEFKYNSSYLQSENPVPVSITLPLTDKVIKSNVLFPFFDGLIPEGWLLALANRNWKIDLNDRFGLLLAVCKDCIGDVSVIGEEE